VARILLVGCGCRGRALAAALVERGHAVRGTTRREEARALIEEAGAQAVLADPDRLATLLPHLDGVSVLCWLMGTPAGPPEAAAALHGPRLTSIGEALVDTHVRGLVYEAAGTVPESVAAGGEETVRTLSRTFHMPVEVVRHPPADVSGWVEAVATGVERVLAA
jgi:nucleoside-diphosphate-sugar epimerase